MNTSEHVLVIILSIFLALFLLLAIMAVVEALLLLHRFRRLMDKAEEVVSSASAAVLAFRRVVGPVGILRLVRTFANSFMQPKGHKKE